MTGIVGGTLSGSQLKTQTDRVSGRRSEQSWHYESGDCGLGLTACSDDTGGSMVWDDGSKGGVVYGAVTNLDELGWTAATLFERFLDSPAGTVEALDGSFVVAAYEAERDRFVVATDKLGARSCYYTETGDFQFASSVSPLVSAVGDPTVDIQAVNDMLLMGHMWGDRTLVAEIKVIRPATVLEVVDGTVTTNRYWKPDYTPHDGGEAYLDELAARYEQAVARVAGTLPESAGIWLSGGLDSRTTSSALLDNTRSDGFQTLTAYGYDANPPTDDNPKIATKIAQILDIDYEKIPLSATTFGEDFERTIEVTDGLLRWNTAANLSASYRVDRETPVLMEGMEGALVGDHLLRYHFDDSQSVVAAQRNSETSASVETVDRLLTADVDPLQSFKDEAERTAESTHRGQVLDVHFQNYHSRLGLASNHLMRDRGGSRVIQADGAYLEWCAKLPNRYRKGTFPLSERVVQSDAGGIPYGTSIAKLELCRRISPELADVTYERTKVSPSKPYPLHAAGFVGNVVLNRLRQKPTYGSGSLQDFWIRDTDTEIHRRVRALVDDATDRDLFDADAVTSVFDEHMSGANNAAMLAQITTIEYWLQEHLD